VGKDRGEGVVYCMEKRKRKRFSVRRERSSIREAGKREVQYEGGRKESLVTRKGAKHVKCYENGGMDSQCEEVGGGVV